MAILLKRPILLVWSVLFCVNFTSALDCYASQPEKDDEEKLSCSTIKPVSVQSDVSKLSDCPDLPAAGASPKHPDEAEVDELESSYKMYQEQSFSSNFPLLSLGEGFYMEEVESLSSYKSVAAYNFIKSPDMPIMVGEGIVNTILFSSDTEENLEYKIVRILKKQPDVNESELVGVFFLLRYLDDPSSMLIRDFEVGDEVIPFKSYILGKFFEVYSEQLPRNLSYLFSLDLESTHHDSWGDEFSMLHENDFLEQEVFIRLDDESSQSVEIDKFYSNYDAQYKGKRIHAFTFIRLPLIGEEVSQQ